MSTPMPHFDNGHQLRDGSPAPERLTATDSPLDEYRLPNFLPEADRDCLFAIAGHLDAYSVTLAALGEVTSYGELDRVRQFLRDQIAARRQLLVELWHRTPEAGPEEAGAGDAGGDAGAGVVR